ncbi:MAG: transglycosylase domain-containing protein [Pseudomonadota bacterium]
MRLAALGASLGSLALGAGLAAAFLYFAPRDQIGADLWAVNRLPSVIVLDRYGDEVAARGARYGEAVRIEDLPDHLVDAFLATEDRRFYNHMGVDIRGTMRAAFSNIKSGGVVEGGSTITQQLAKVLFLSPEQTYERKIREALLALWLEGHYEKNEILSLYLNRIYLGAGAYGIESASKTYFNKSASDVTLAEAVLLAGLPKAPSSLAPTQNPFGAESRAREVLDNLLETGAVTPFEARTARENPPVITSSNVDAGLGYFFDYVAAKAQEYAIARANDASDNSAGDNSAGDGSAGEKNSGAARAQATIRNDLIVSTTLDLRMQKAAEAAIAKAITTEAKLAGAEQAALVAYDADGALRALVGGVSYVESQFNRATQAKRQPGSAFKPFVYVAALENGVTTQTKFIDQPVDIDGWRPENYSGRFDGPMRLTEALAKSVNTIAVQITEQVGRKKVAEAAKRLGVKADVPAHPSIALGASNMTLEDLTAAYLPLARGGLSADPYAITKIVDQSGNIVFERDAAPAKRVLSAKVSRDMNHLLYQVMHNGTGGRAQLGRRAAVGKTGTTNDWRDAWFMGYTAQMTAGVWVGNDNFRGMEKITGGKIPAEIWRDFMLAAHQDLPRRPINGATPAVIHADEGALLSFYDDVARGLRTVRRDGGDGGGRRVFRRR